LAERSVKKKTPAPRLPSPAPRLPGRDIFLFILIDS